MSRHEGLIGETHQFNPHAIEALRGTVKDAPGVFELYTFKNEIHDDNCIFIGHTEAGETLVPAIMSLLDGKKVPGTENATHFRCEDRLALSPEEEAEILKQRFQLAKGGQPICNPPRTPESWPT